MGQKAKSRGFYTPFSSLKKHTTASVVSTAQKPPDRSAAAKKTEAELVSDAALFAQAVTGSEPHRSKVHREHSPKQRAKTTALLSDDALAIAELESMVRGEGEFRVHESEEVHFGLAPGVDRALLDRLLAGEFAFFHCLDLHGMIRETAHEAVSAFIRRSRCELGASCVLVVTGRGRGSPDGKSVLREALPRWLTRSPIKPHVLAFCTARAIDGGPGAFYVLLRRQGQRPGEMRRLR